MKSRCFRSTFKIFILLFAIAVHVVVVVVVVVVVAVVLIVYFHFGLCSYSKLISVNVWHIFLYDFCF